MESGCPTFHDARWTDSFRHRTRGLARRHSSQDWEGTVQHGLRQLVDGVQLGQGHGQADVGRGPQQEADYQPNPGTLLDDIKESTNNRPPEARLPSLKVIRLNSKNYDLNIILSQAAVTATFLALRNQSPLVPTVGNIAQSELARRRKRSKPKNEGSTSTPV